MCAPVEGRSQRIRGDLDWNLHGGSVLLPTDRNTHMRHALPAISRDT